MSQVLDQVFQRSAVSHEGRKVCQVSAMAQQAIGWERGLTALAFTGDGSEHLNNSALVWPRMGHEPNNP